MFNTRKENDRPSDYLSDTYAGGWNIIFLVRSQEAVVLTRGRWQLPWNYPRMGVGGIIRLLGLTVDHYPNAAASWHTGSLFHA